MALIQVVEHEKIFICDDGSMRKSITSLQAKLLKNIETKLPKRTFEWGHQSIKFNQYCGVISLGGDSIAILPKIYGNENEPCASRNILIKMLYAARRLKPVSGGSANIGLQKHHLLDVFIQHFCNELFQQLRKGVIRSYIRRTDNLHVLRGKLLIDKHLKVNASNKERMYCQYDELIDDNKYNQVIKYVLQILIKVTVSGKSKRKITELLYCFDEVSDKTFIADDVLNIPIDRSTSRFKIVFEYCSWFLQGLNPDVVTGEQHSLALLFDMNKLFEEFIARKLKVIAWEKGLKLREQGPQKRFIQSSDTDNSFFVMKPDISLIDSNNKVVSILDTKWKVLNDSDNKLGVSQQDLYQMAGYAMRYGCKKMVLIYPKVNSLDSERPIEWKFINTDIQIFIWTIDLTEVFEKKKVGNERQLSDYLNDLTAN